MINFFAIIPACFLTFCCSAIPSVTHLVMLSTITWLSSFSYLKPGLIMNSFTGDDYVQWLLENHPDSLPAHICPVDKMDTEKPPQHSTPLRHREPSQRCDRSVYSGLLLTARRTWFIPRTGKELCNGRFWRTNVSLCTCGTRHFQIYWCEVLALEYWRVLNHLQWLRKRKRKEEEEARKQEREIKRAQRDFSKWMHKECLEKDSDDCVICPLCYTLFK